LLPNHHNWSWYNQWMILDGLEGDPSAWCDTAGWLLYSGWLKIQLARSHFRAIIHGTNWQKTQTIASQLPQLILIHPMDDFGWAGRGSKCMMWCSRLVIIVLRAVENSAVGIRSHSCAIIHIQVHDVMQQAGYCVQGSGKFS
jgi:hypothetical protein